MSCKCDTGSPNTGFPKCLSSDAPLIGFLVVNLFDSSGVRNKIDNAAALDQAWLDGKINETLDEDRFYPVLKMENVTQEREDPTTETAESGTVGFIKQGVKTVTGEFWYQSRQWQGKIDDWRCQQKGVYGIYLDGTILGKCIDTTGDLYQIEVEQQSWYATFVDATDTTLSKVALSFQVAQTERERDFYQITNEEYTMDLLGAKGLL